MLLNIFRITARNHTLFICKSRNNICWLTSSSFLVHSPYLFCLTSYRFRATLYPCPESQGERKEMALGVNTRIEDLQAVR